MVWPKKGPLGMRPNTFMHKKVYQWHIICTITTANDANEQRFSLWILVNRGTFFFSVSLTLPHTLLRRMNFTKDGELVSLKRNIIILDSVDTLR